MMKKSHQFNMSSNNLNLNEQFKLVLNIEGIKKADKGDFDSALEYFSKSIHLTPIDSVSYFNRAHVKLIIGDVKGAMSDIKSTQTNELTKILLWVYHIIIGISVLMMFL